MLNIAFDLKNQIISDLESSSNLEKISYENLLIMGMGGSGVAGDVMKVLSNEISDKNIIVHKEYSIPKQFLKFRPYVYLFHTLATQKKRYQVYLMPKKII